MSPPEWRCVETPHGFARARENEHGDLIVQLISGAVSISMTIPASQAAFLLSPRTDEARAA